MTQHTKELQKIKESACNFLPKGAFIAGGALTSVFTGQPISDTDIYFKTKEDFLQAVCQAYDERLWCVAGSDRAVTFIYDNRIIQLMHFDFFPTAEDIFDAFDYTVCMAAYDIDTEEFIFHEDFMKHSAQRYLSFHSGTRYPYGSLLRVLKYQQRGFTIGKGDLLRIALCCSQVHITSWDELAAAIGGQYGDKAKIETDIPFSIEAALELYKNTDITVSGGPSEEMPRCASALLYKLNLITEEQQEDYDW